MKQAHRSETLEGGIAPPDSVALPQRLAWPAAALLIGATSLVLWVLIVAGVRALA